MEVVRNGHGDCAAGVGAIDLCVHCLDVQDCRPCRMAEEVVSSNTDERKSGLHGSDEFGRGGVCRTVVPDLEDVGAYIDAARQESTLGFKSRIASKQDAKRMKS